MSARSLLIACVLGVVLSVVVAGLAVRDLAILPDLVSLPDLQGLDTTRLSGNPRLQELVAAWSTESTAAIKSFRAASASALALARSGAQERAVLGIGFAVIFGFVALHVSRLSRKV
jgi:hypothetical protein